MTRKYGPPAARAKQYPYVLEVLEAQANKKLTSEYLPSVKQWMSVLEQQSAANAQMIDLQPEVQWYMRPYLLDFLVELHQLFRLQPSTLFLCVNIIDRYCAKRIVFKRHYQLVGCTALWIAGKYEDKKLRVPTLRELAIMCRQAYDEEMFVQMEMHILATLEWLLGHPSLEECLQLAISEAGVLNATPCKYNRPAGMETLKVSAVTAVGRFFCELSLYDRFFLTMPALLIAVAANLLACSMLGVPAAAQHLRDLMVALPTLHAAMAGHENTAPTVQGPFLLGLDAAALALVRRIALVLFANTNQLSDVLQRKYDALGVMPVIHNYQNRHPLIAQAIIDNTAAIVADDAAMGYPEIARAADVLLLLPAGGKHPYQDLPLTPPLASQSLVFSHGSSAYTTPILHGGQFSQYSPMPPLDSWTLPLGKVSTGI